MGRVDIPLGDRDPREEKRQELPQCSWCGARSLTICGRCRVRAYCGAECQRLDWRSGHQTACSSCVPAEPVKEESLFQFYHTPCVARWAINLATWHLEPDSQEFSFLLGRIEDEEARARITASTPWSAVKKALAKELAVRRLAEVMTQAMWHKVRWKRDLATGREFLVDREEYIWTGKKYQNANTRFPNFNFSIAEAADYLFIVSHPLALTGVYAGGPLSASLPDPRAEFSAALGALDAADADVDTEEAVPGPLGPRPGPGRGPPGRGHGRGRRCGGRGAGRGSGGRGRGRGGCSSRGRGASALPLLLSGDESEALQDDRPSGSLSPSAPGEGQEEPESCQPDTVVGSMGSHASNVSMCEGGDGVEDLEAGDPREDAEMFGADELRRLCGAPSAGARRRALRRAVVGKLAYFRTRGQTSCRPWTQVVLGQQPVGDSEPGGRSETGDDDCAEGAGRSEDGCDEEEVATASASSSTSRRHALRISGSDQRRWRIELHDWRGCCIAVCRAPPGEALDWTGEFRSTQAVRFPEIDAYDNSLEHEEPPFLEVPIKQLLPEKWQSDYERARGSGERGERTRMNYLGPRAPHVPSFKRAAEVPRV